jgi:hypothetical protein
MIGPTAERHILLAIPKDPLHPSLNFSNLIPVDAAVVFAVLHSNTIVPGTDFPRHSSKNASQGLGSARQAY